MHSLRNLKEHIESIDVLRKNHQNYAGIACYKVSESDGMINLKERRS